MDSAPLADWLIAECERRHLSWSEASRKAGVSPNTISQIINGTPAGTKRLTALADFFGISPEYLFQLAGLLPKPPAPNDDPEIRRVAQEIIRIWRRLKDTDPEAARRLMNIAIVQAEAFEAAVNAASNRMEEENQEPEQNMARRGD